MAAITVTSNCNVDDIAKMRFIATRSGTTTAGGQASKPSAITYVSETDFGKTTQVRSITPTHIVQIIGYAVATDILSFKPDYTYIEIA